MLFLSVILSFTLQAWSMPVEKKLKKQFQTYVVQASRGKVNPKLYTKDFKSILKDDKIIYKVCAQYSCNIKMKVTRTRPNAQTWMLKAQITYGTKTPKTLSVRRGWYLFQGIKLFSYLEDCDDR